VRVSFVARTLPTNDDSSSRDPSSTNSFMQWRRLDEEVPAGRQRRLDVREPVDRPVEADGDDVVGGLGKGELREVRADGIEAVGDAARFGVLDGDLQSDAGPVDSVDLVAALGQKERIPSRPGRQVRRAPVRERPYVPLEEFGGVRVGGCSPDGRSGRPDPGPPGRSVLAPTPALTAAALRARSPAPRRQRVLGPITPPLPPPIRQAAVRASWPARPGLAERGWRSAGQSALPAARSAAAARVPSSVATSTQAHR